MKKSMTLALMCAFALGAATFASCDKVDDNEEGGGNTPGQPSDKTFTSIAALSSWLAGQPANTADKAYRVGLQGVNLDSGNNWGELGIAIGDTNEDKYVSLDLSGSTGTVIPDGRVTAGGSSGSFVYHGVFVDCDNLVSIKLSSGLTTIGKYAFRDCGELVNVVLPGTVGSIHDYAFHMCEKLASVNLPSGLREIGRYGFFACPLVAVVIPEGITTISEDAFAGVVSITLPNSLQSIEGYAFWESDGLTSITIPANVTSIGRNAFEYCRNLAEVIMLPATPPTLQSYGGEYDVFDLTHSSLRIRVPAASVNAYKAANGWKKYAGSIVAD